MQKFVKALLAGAAGAVSVTVLHELTRHWMPHPPRLDLLGMRTLAKGARWLGQEPPEHLRSSALAGDVVANTLYYSVVGVAGAGAALGLGAALGAAAGIGALLLPGPMGVGPALVNRTGETQAAAAGLYLAGGVVAGAVYQALGSGEQEDEPEPEIWW